MKKRVVTGMIVLGLLATACSRQKEAAKGSMSENFVPETMESAIDTSETDILSETSAESEALTETAKEDSVNDIPEEAYDLSSYTPMEAFRMVVLNEAPFVYSNPGAEHLNGQGYFNDAYFCQTYLVYSFAINDMDGDEVPEILIDLRYGMSDLAPYGYPSEVLLLRYDQGKVLGNLFSIKEMTNIQTNGTFSWSSDAFHGGVNSIFFIENTPVKYHILESENSLQDAFYYHHDIPIEENAYKEMRNASRPGNLEWYAFTPEEITKHVTEAQMSDDIDWNTNPRQDYLNSLSYLLDFFPKGSKMDLETKNQAHKKYYYNSIAEMETIFKLCQEKLTGTELASLEEEQLLWQEGIEARLVSDLYKHNNVESIEELANWTLYRNYGDMYLRRTAYLINIYYN